MEKYSKSIESTLFRIKRRYQYVKYCYSTLTSNVYHEPTVDVILEQLLVPIGKLSGNQPSMFYPPELDCLEKTIVKIALLFVPLVHFMVLCVAYMNGSQLSIQYFITTVIQVIITIIEPLIDI